MGCVPGRVFLALLVSSVAGGLIAGCEKTLVNVIPLVGLQIALTSDGCLVAPGQVTLLEAEEENLEACLTGPGGEPLTGRPVTWRSDNSDVALVTPTGTLRGVSPGVTAARVAVENLQASIPVTVLQGRTISLSPELLQLQGPSGEAPLEAQVQVENAGNGTLSGLSASVEIEGGEATDWLIASLQGTSAPTTLLVQVLLADLSPSFYRGTVRVADPLALNSPQTVEVEVQVGEPLPKIGLDLTAVQFVAPSGAFQPAIQEVSVENVGGGVLGGLAANVTYLSGGAVGWLSVVFAAGEAPTTLELSANARFLAPGTYVADVEVTSTTAPGASGTVRVTFAVQ